MCITQHNQSANAKSHDTFISDILPKTGVSIKVLLKIWQRFGNDLIMIQLSFKTSVLGRNAWNYGVMPSCIGGLTSQTMLSTPVPSGPCSGLSLSPSDPWFHLVHPSLLLAPTPVSPVPPFGPTTIWPHLTPIWPLLQSGLTTPYLVLTTISPFPHLASSPICLPMLPSEPTPIWSLPNSCSFQCSFQFWSHLVFSPLCKDNIFHLAREKC